MSRKKSEGRELLHGSINTNELVESTCKQYPDDLFLSIDFWSVSFSREWNFFMSIFSLHHPFVIEQTPYCLQGKDENSWPRGDREAFNNFSFQPLKLSHAHRKYAHHRHVYAVHCSCLTAFANSLRAPKAAQCCHRCCKTKSQLGGTFLPPQASIDVEQGLCAEWVGEIEAMY